MMNLLIILKIVLLNNIIVLAKKQTNTTTNHHNSLDKYECINRTTKCVRCGPNGCIKCTEFIMYETRECVTSCPLGYSTQWSNIIDYMGQMCVNTGNIYGLEPATFAILLGATLGLLLCLSFMIFGLMYQKYRRNKSKIQNRRYRTNSYDDDYEDERMYEFLKQVEQFRPHAYTFLNMLNDTRRQIREINYFKCIAAASDERHGASSFKENSLALTDCDRDVAAYKKVVCDLAKLLVILNKPNEQLVDIPQDWERLFIWADKLLKRYRRFSDHSLNYDERTSTATSSSSTAQPQVAQLIDFLQTPLVETNQKNRQTFMSTFKPEDIAIHTFNNNYDNNIMLKNTTSSSSTTTTTDNCLMSNNSFRTSGNSDSFNQIIWEHSQEYMSHGCWLETTFNASHVQVLGLRPQDEITTEL